MTTADSTAAPRWWAVVGRVLAAVLALGLVLLGTTFLNSSSLTRTVGGEFGCSQVSDTNILDCLTNSTSVRTVSVALKVAQTPRADISISVQPDDLIVSDTAMRLFRLQPWTVGVVFGNIAAITRRGETVDFAPTVPVVRQSDKSTTVAIAFLPSSAGIRSDDLEQISYVPPVPLPEASNLSTSVSGTLKGVDLASIEPRSVVLEQDPSHFSTVPTGSSSTIVFHLSNGNVNTIVPSVFAGGGIDRVGPLVWGALPWLIFLVAVAARRRRRSAWSPRAWDQLAPSVAVLVALSLLLAAQISGGDPVLGSISRGFNQTVELIRHLEDSGNSAPPTSSLLLVMPVLPISVMWIWGLAFSRARPTIRPIRSLVTFASVVVIVGGVLATVFTQLGMSVNDPVIWGIGLGAVLVGSAIFGATMRTRTPVIGGAVAAVSCLPFALSSQLIGVMWIQIIVHLLTVALIACATCTLAYALVTVSYPRNTAARVLFPLAVGATTVAIAAPFTIKFNEDVGASDLDGVLVAFLQLVQFGLIALLVAGLSDIRVRNSSLGRWAALLLAAVLVFRTDVTYYGLPVGSFAGIAVLGLYLMPRSTEPARGLDVWAGPRRIARLARDYVSAVGEARIDKDYAGGLRRKISTGDVETSSYKELRDAIVAVQYGPATSSLPDREQALGWGGLASPVERGAVGLAVAVVIGIPFAVTPIGQLFESFGTGSGVSLFSQVLSLLLGLRFPLYGFAFGYLLPALRGSSAMTKAVWLALVVMLTEVLVVLLPYDWNATTAAALLLRCVQIASVFIALGAVFDFQSLRAGGFQIDRIGDIYNVNRATVWISGILITAAAGSATALLTSASAALIARIIPGGSN